MKISVQFNDFSAQLAGVGLKALQLTPSIFYVKSDVDGAGKVEFNLNSTTFTVGSGSKHLQAITDAVVAAGFKLIKANKGWTILAVDLFDYTGTGEITQQFSKLVGVVESTVAGLNSNVKAKAPKVKEDMHAASNRMIAKAIASGNLTTATVVSIEKSADEIAAIKAKNLDTMKKVSAKSKKKVIDTTVAEVATVDILDDDSFADRELIKGMIPKAFHKECGLL